MPRTQFTTSALMILIIIMMAIPVAGFIGGPLSGVLLRLDGVQGLGGYPRFRSLVSGLGSYGAVRRNVMMGDTSTDTSSFIASTGSAISDIIRASEGQPQSPYEAAVIAAGQPQPLDPWASFRTPYTPGGPPAGYAQPGASISVGASSNWVWFLLIGLGIAMVLRPGR